jgi:CheY-like chemotaxis protein
MLTNEQFLEYLRDALYHLYEPDRLRASPLAALFGTANRLDTFAALQRILIEAISSLEPDVNEPPSSSAWEIYEPLFYRFVQQSSQQQVARQLGMSVRHLRRKEHAAIEVLAAHLWRRFKLEIQQPHVGAGEPEQTQPTTSPSVAEELAWLKNTPPESPTNLGQTLPHALHLVEPLAAQHGIILETSLTDHQPYLSVHEVALSQTLVTLLGEAIRCATGGQVSVSVQALSTEVEIHIRGVKSPSNTRPAVKADKDHLDLAQEIADLCGGKLEMSDSETSFDATWVLPALEQLPVLVIDDNVDTLQLLRRYTVGTRYRLFTAQHPEDALGLIEKFSPRIIVVDVMMPRVDGWTVLAQLRQHPLTEHIPIIVCTILPQEEMALTLGASGFVHKPITRQAFLDALDQQVRRLETEPR